MWARTKSVAEFVRAVDKNPQDPRIVLDDVHEFSWEDIGQLFGLLSRHKGLKINVFDGNVYIEGCTEEAH